MSTFAEIASAADRLPISEQHKLLERLASKLRFQPSRPRLQVPTIDRAAREAWLARLGKLRKEITTGHQSVSTEQILEELREDRL